MAAKSPAESFAPVLAALATMQSNGSRQEKGQAHEFLEQFQKSVSYASSPTAVRRLTINQ